MTQKLDTPAGAPPAEGRRGATTEPERFVPDIVEHGGPLRGQPQALNRRLFLQLQVFTACFDASAVVDAVKQSGLEAVVYANVNDARGVGVLTMSEDPAVFAEGARELYLSEPFLPLVPLPAFAMLGRTYATGREPDLEYFLLYKARRHALNPELGWAVWYPLRRIGAFNRLPKAEQGKIMAEHAMLGRAYGEAGYAVDIRLECHGLDRDDNEFVIGILGSELHPLSKLIKDMRSTRQTSEFMQSMGPFFVGRVIYQAPLIGAAKPRDVGY
jgi:chlorite dismutase